LVKTFDKEKQELFWQELSKYFDEKIKNSTSFGMLNCLIIVADKI